MKLVRIRMKVLIAPDSFKGSLSAREVAESIALGVASVYPEAQIVKLPLADGGEGTVDALVTARGGRIIHKEVVGPLGQPVQAFFGLLGDENTAIIEMAAASGLELVPPERRNPLKTTTYGTGQLIAAALDEGVERIIIGIGGSATNDAGLGMAQALGVGFKDAEGQELGYGGEELTRLVQIDLSNLDRRIGRTEIIVASDVTNPLYGEKGAAHVFGPQKGASPADVELLDQGLRNFAQVVEKQFGWDVASLPGAGAAGGLGAALAVFLGARLESGISFILDSCHFDDHLKKADLVITGEGKLDAQTLMGKAPFGVAQRAKKRGVPVLALGGAVDPSAVSSLNKYLDAVFSITQAAVELEQAKPKAREWLQVTTEQVLRCLRYLPRGEFRS